MNPPSRVGALLLVVALLVLAARATAAQAQLPAVTENVDLVSGCTNVSLTWPVNTSIATVAAAIVPAGAVHAIWKLDARSQQYRGYAPAVSQASDLATVGPLDAVFICTNTLARMARPVLGSGVLAGPPPPPPVAGGPARIVFVTPSAGRGGSASITVQAPPGARCDIQYTPPLGSPPATTGLGPKVVDGSGYVNWVWTVGFFTVTGQAAVVVRCGGASVAAAIAII